MRDLDVEILINKDNLLPRDYVPYSLLALDDNENNFHQYQDPYLKPMVREDIACDLFDMFGEAKKKGFSIIVDSGYRSYDYQFEILNKKIKELGEKQAYKIVALPGASEHQSGLCFDIAYLYDGVYNSRVTIEDEEVKWLIDNSYKYGFILRYPNDKEHVTGYLFEPWHYRYVGKRLSEILYKNGEVLEEYYRSKKQILKKR